MRNKVIEDEQARNMSIELIKNCKGCMVYVINKDGQFDGAGMVGPLSQVEQVGLMGLAEMHIKQQKESMSE